MPLEDGLLRRRPPHGGAVRDLVRQPERQIGGAPQEVERLRARGLRDQLRAEIRRADRVRLGDDRGPPRLVPPDGEAEAEGEDRPDQTEERGLEDADRLAQDVGVPPQVAADGRAEDARADDDPEDEERDRPARQREEHGATPRDLDDAAPLQQRIWFRTTH
jgi:hypothetical protein